MNGILTVDIGNTNIKIAYFQGKQLEKVWSLTSEKDLKIKDLAKNMERIINQDSINVLTIEAVVICSVVEELTTKLRKIFEDCFQLPVYIIGVNLEIDLQIDSNCDGRIGTDRIVCGYASLKVYGAPCIVVCCGTATTISVIDERGFFIGGAILPGIKVSSDIMTLKIWNLYNSALTRPQSVIGQDLHECMNIGTYYGFIGQIEGIIKRIKEEMNLPFKVVLTGGLSNLINNDLEVDTYHNQYLILEGIRLIWDNKKRLLNLRDGDEVKQSF
ncbi:type III pantothenate kinase [Sutcliffiella halmapala]|uniref:type III pantothenate kinase n=1 Tax=Sutcliffiella halmapala TaxID=79882 RepID=UPI0009953CE3|nr:type III pantothenate kinase [Sutcliffiella halmapala]